MKKLSYCKIILILMYAVVALFMLMVVNSVLEAQNDDLYYNEFYSKYIRVLNTPYGNASDLDFRNFGDEYSLYYSIFEVQDRERDSVRAVYMKGDMPQPDIVEGRFFTADEFASDEPVAVLGTLLKRSVESENGIDYYTYAGVRYTVVGYMGIDGLSDVDAAAWLNMGAYFKTASAYGKFVFDAKDSTSVDASVAAFLTVLPEEIRNQTVEVMYDRKIRSISFFTTEIYKYIVIAMMINIAIVSVYYIDKRIYITAVKKLVGYPFRQIAADIMCEYALLSAIGVAIGSAGVYLMRFTPFSSSDELSFMTLSLPAVALTFFCMIIVALLLSIFPILRVYNAEISKIIK